MIELDKEALNAAVYANIDGEATEGIIRAYLSHPNVAKDAERIQDCLEAAARGVIQQVQACDAYRERIKALEEKVRHYTDLLDKQMGTPCEQIRSAERIKALEATIKRMSEALKPFAEKFLYPEDTYEDWKPEDYDELLKENIENNTVSDYWLHPNAIRTARALLSVSAQDDGIMEAHLAMKSAGLV